MLAGREAGTIVNVAHPLVETVHIVRVCGERLVQLRGWRRRLPAFLWGFPSLHLQPFLIALGHMDGQTVRQGHQAAEAARIHMGMFGHKQ